MNTISTLQVLLAAVVAGDDAGAAVARPRLHHQWSPNEVRDGVNSAASDPRKGGKPAGR